MTGPTTAADRQRYLAGGLADLACDQCGAVVRVRKHSLQQTSVQWSLEATGRCEEFALRRALGEQTARVMACAKLRETIEHAVRDGRLAVLAPEGTPVEPAPRGRPPHGGADNDEAMLEQEALELATAHVPKAAKEKRS
jgi:hypothetical protein